MSFSLHVSPGLAKQILDSANAMGVSKNKFINLAIKDYLHKQKIWSDAVMNFNGLDGEIDISRDDFAASDDQPIF